MFSFQEMINFDNLAKSGGAGSSVSTEMSVATVGVSSSSPGRKVSSSSVKVSSALVSKKVSKASRVSKFIPPRCVKNEEQETKDILNKLISIKPKPSKKSKGIDRDVLKKIGRKVLKSRSGASEKVSGANESDIVKLVKANHTDFKVSSDSQVQQAPEEIGNYSANTDESLVNSSANTADSTDNSVVISADNSSTHQANSLENYSGNHSNLITNSSTSSTNPANNVGNLFVENSDLEIDPIDEDLMYNCDECKKSFKYLKRFKDHKLKGNCNSAVTCAQCGRRLKDAKNFKRHVRRVHGGKVYQCANCPKTFPNEKTVNKHFLHNHVKHMCKYCKKSFKNSNSLRTHQHKCLTKKASTGQVQNNDISAGSKSEVGGDKVKDDETPKPAARKPKTTNNSENQSGQTKKFFKKCSQCGKTYNSKGGFNKHKNTHNQTVKKNPVSVNEVIVVNEDILKALENGGFIIQEEGDIETVPNSDGMLLVLDSNANL